MQAAARLVYTIDDWKTVRQIDLTPAPLSGWYADVALKEGVQELEFTFYWIDAGSWEGRNLRIESEMI